MLISILNKWTEVSNKFKPKNVSTCFITQERLEQSSLLKFPKSAFHAINVSRNLINFSFPEVFQIAKQNGIFRLQWFRWLDVKSRHLWVFVGLCWRSIQIPFSLLFIKISRNGIWSLLYSIVNCIEELIAFKVSNNSSGLIWLLLKTV